MALFAGNWSKILYCLVLAVSLVIVCQLLVTGFSGEGTENDTLWNCSQGLFHNIYGRTQGKSFGCNRKLWGLGCWTLLVLTGVGCHSDCCAGLSKAVSKWLSLELPSQSRVTWVSQMHIDSLHLPDLYWLAGEYNTCSLFCSSSSYHGFQRKEIGRRDPKGAATCCIQSSDQDDWHYKWQSSRSTV